MKTPLTFQIILMTAFAIVLATAPSPTPHAPTRAIVAPVKLAEKKMQPSASIETEAEVNEFLTHLVVLERDDFIISCTGTNYAESLDRQPKEFPQTPAEVREKYSAKRAAPRPGRL